MKRGKSEYFKTDSPLEAFAQSLSEKLEQSKESHDSIVFVCIGSDRSTGDSLGPLTGHNLKGINSDNVFLFGTLESPVHARNLETTISCPD